MSNQQTGSLGPLYVRDLQAGVGQQLRGTLAFIAEVNVADPAGLADTVAALLSLDNAGRLRTLVTPASTAIFPVQPAVLGESLGVAGRVVAPVAAGVITSIAAGSIPAGTYLVQASAVLDAGGPVAGTDYNNMVLKKGAAVIATLQVTGTISDVNPFDYVLIMDGATAITVNAIGAATAGVGYNAALAIRRIA